MTSAEARVPHKGATWDLRLYIAGRTPRDLRAVDNLHGLCERHLPGRCRIEVVDLAEHPELAAEHQILAVPTLVRRAPLPVRKVIGDLSAQEAVLRGLDIGGEAR